MVFLATRNEYILRMMAKVVIQAPELSLNKKVEQIIN